MSAYTRTRRELVRLVMEWKDTSKSCSIEGDRQWVNGVVKGLKIALEIVEKMYRLDKK